MSPRTKFLMILAISGVTVALPMRHWAMAAEPTSQPTHHGEENERDDEEHEDERGAHQTHESREGKHGEENEHEDHERDGEEHHREIETPVQLNMVPQAVLDAVKAEAPGGTISEAELEVKKGKIVYGFDVKVGQTVYDINVSVDGKFISKTVDDEADEAGEKDDEHGR